ncbi:unnamed protein product [Effrenium voratum]|uniref:Uncharacterized protein n=1 Tax=Effrenium voratum TaxID=2562239 RepID=A0AA36J6U9_9DINO|nr:unnamed protein product [Effrenium voratum]
MAGIGAIIGPRVVDSGRRQRAFSHCGVAKPRFSRDQPIVVPVVSKEPKPCQPAGKGLARRSASGRHRRSPEHLRRKAQKGMPEPGGGRRRQGLGSWPTCGHRTHKVAVRTRRLLQLLWASRLACKQAVQETSAGPAMTELPKTRPVFQLRNSRAQGTNKVVGPARSTPGPSMAQGPDCSFGASLQPFLESVQAPPVQQSATPLQGAPSHGQAKANAHNAPTNSVPGEQAILEAEAEAPSVLRRPGDALEGWPAKEAAEAEESMQEPHLHRAPEAKDALPGLSAEGLAKEAEEHAHRAAKDASPGAGAAEAEARARREQADALPGEGRPARTAAEAEAPRVRTAPPAKDVATGGPTRTAAEAEAQRVRRPSSAKDAATGGPTRAAAEAEALSVRRAPSAKDAATGRPTRTAAEAEAPRVRRAPSATDAATGGPTRVAAEAEALSVRRAPSAKDAATGRPTRTAAEAEAPRIRRAPSATDAATGGPATVAAEAEALSVRRAPSAKDAATGRPTRTAAEAEAPRVRRAPSATDAATGGPARVAAEAEALSVRRAPSAKDAATGRPTRTAAEAEAPRIRRAPSATDAATGGPARVAAEAEEPRARRALDAKDSMPGRAGHHGIEEAPLARMPRAADALPGGQASPADDVEAQLTPRSRTSSKDQGAQPGCEEAKANEASGMRAWPAATNAMPGPEAPQATLRRASAEGVDRRIQVPTVQGMERGPDAAKQEPLAKKAEVSQRGPSLRSNSTSSRQGSTRKANQGSLAERTPRTDRFAHWADATWKLAHTGYGQPWAGLLPSVPKQGLEAIDLENMQVFCDPALLQGMQVPELSSRAMGTAFCDRSVRLRDGCAVRALLQPDPLEETAQVGCENERMMPPAGLRSFEFAENKQQEPREWLWCMPLYLRSCQLAMPLRTKCSSGER